MPAFRPPQVPNQLYSLPKREGRNIILQDDLKGKMLTKVWMHGRWMYVP